jgi:DNA-binding transcriptional MerR regulator
VWTIDELVDRVRTALAAEYPGAPNGRVRDLPDRRAVRWYTTIGLVDRPAMRGRTALYGHRHLLQLVALKRRQAAGRTLAEIQAELAGATDRTLTEIARIPAGRTADARHHPAEPPSRRRFWTEPTAAPGDAPAAPPAEPDRPTDQAAAAPPAEPLTGISLDGGVILLLPARPGLADYPAIAAAARPLLDLLAARGLADQRNSPNTDRSSS